MIIAISAKQQAGKTTLVEQFQLNTPNHKVVKFAKPIYDIQNLVYQYLSQYGVEPVAKDGEFLQSVGEHFRVKYGPDFWANIGNKAIDQFHSKTTDHVPLTAFNDDLRHTSEFDVLGDGAFKLRLECPEADRKARSTVWRDNTTHPSEIGLDEYSKQGKFHYYIHTGVRSPRETFEMAWSAVKLFKAGQLNTKGDFELIKETMWDKQVI